MHPTQTAQNIGSRSCSSRYRCFICTLCASNRNRTDFNLPLSTGYPCHAEVTELDFKDAKTAISKIRVQKIPTPPRNAHIIERNLEVLSWSKPLLKKNHLQFKSMTTLGTIVCPLSLPTVKIYKTNSTLKV